MPEITPRLGLKKPLSNEAVTRAAYNENLDIIDQNAVKSSDHTAHLAEGMPEGVHGIATTANLTLYVDAALGNDSNDGLTAGTALATIQAAVNKVPKYLVHAVTVSVAAGTYPETVRIEGFVGSGTFTLQGGATTADAVNYLVNKVEVFTCACKVVVQGFKGTDNTVQYGEFRANDSLVVFFNYCRAETTSNIGVYVSNTICNLVGCVVSNHTAYGLSAYKSFVSCDAETYGNNNSTGVRASMGAVVDQSGGNTYFKVIRGITNVWESGGIVLPGVTINTTNLYVRPDGSDDNDGSANDAAHALKTIQEAINRIPRIVNHTVTVNVVAGTFNEDVYIQGFTGKGLLQVIGASVLSDSYVVNKVHVIQCEVYVIVRGLKGTVTTDKAFCANGCVYVLFDYCKNDAAASYPGFDVLWNSVVRIENSLVSNRLYGIRALGSRVFSNANSGTGNTTALRAENVAKIGKSGTQPAGTTAESTGTGGQIVA